MKTPLAIRLAAGLGLVGVGLGAFGAHGLKARLAAFGTESFWETAVIYHLVHAVALLAIAERASAFVTWLWVGGIGVFSGSLYVLALTDARWLGAITPIGGVSLIVGWALLLGRGR